MMVTDLMKKSIYCDLHIFIYNCDYRMPYNQTLICGGRMLIKKLDLTKKQTDAFVIASGIVILALILVIGMMVLNSNNPSTDIDFLGYGFKVTDQEVLIKTPQDDWTSVSIDDSTYHSLESLNENINEAYNKWHSALRNGIVFLYLVTFFIIIIKKKDSYFQGILKGFLAGSALLLLLFTLQSLLELSSLLVSFSHDFTHFVF